MYETELFFRFAAISQLILVAVILLKDHRTSRAGLLGALFALAIVSDLVACPCIVHWDWGRLIYPILAMSAAIPILFWLLCKALFEDSFRFRWHHLVILVTFEAIAFVGFHLTDGGTITGLQSDSTMSIRVALLPQALSLVLVILALMTAIKDWRMDLVESRRRLRAVMLISMGILMFYFAILKGSQVGASMPEALDALNLALVFGVALVFNVLQLSLRSSLLFEPAGGVRPVQKTADDYTATFIGKLERLMDEERLFTREGLTIHQLADSLRLPEYRVRQLINGHMGYRNFNQYLNKYRIKEASRQLIDPETRHLPVLSIALDVGYRSLAPFNKAFKDFHGMTPTAYRSANTTVEDSVRIAASV